MECGVVSVDGVEDDWTEEKRKWAAAKKDMAQTMKYYSEEIYLLWKLFCRVEAYCQTQEAAYMCVLGMEERAER